jgi:2-hydroxychromene-2-carboxylate isomerase
MADFARHAARYGVPLGLPRNFPLNSLNLMRGAIAAQNQGREIPYGDAIYRAIFGEQRNMEDPVVIGEVLRKAGFDPAALLAAIGTPEVKDRLRANTEEAVARGVFGAPTFFIGKTMHFGQDRLDFVEEDVKKAA